MIPKYTRRGPDPPPDSICFEAQQMLSTFPLQGEVLEPRPAIEPYAIAHKGEVCRAP